MSNKAFSQREEMMFDAMLKVAATESMMRDLETLPSNEELKCMNLRSDTFNKRMMSIIHRAENAQKRKRMARWTYKAAAIFGLIFTVSTITLMSVEASRVFILNTLFAVTHDDHVVFEFGDAGQISESISAQRITMPNEFILIKTQEMANMSIFIYENATGEKVTIQRNIGMSASVFIDNKQREYVALTVSDVDVYLFEATSDNYHNFAVWNDGEHVLQVTVQFDVERLLTLVETIIRNTP